MRRMLPTLTLTLSQTWERGLTPYGDYSFPLSEQLLMEEGSAK